jgi:ComF family protein
MKLLQRITTAFLFLCNRLLPTQCLLCADKLTGELLCEGCLYDLPWIQRHEITCPQCALAFESLDDFCRHCLNNPPAFSASFIPFSYQHPLTPLIHRFKYRTKLSHGKLLGQLLTQHIIDCADNTQRWTKPDLIIPVPMHWTRRWQRGFNQTEILARYVAKTTGIPLATNMIQRCKRTLAQKELSRSERQKNLTQAFSISLKATQHIQGKKIALLDDVVTTTATVRALSQQLKDAGASDVQIWALARTMEKPMPEQVTK